MFGAQPYIDASMKKEDAPTKMTYMVWIRKRIEDDGLSSAPFDPTFPIERGYDAFEMAVFLRNGKQNDVYVECLETGSIYSQVDMHVLASPLFNLKF
jgi:hypothetical protein